MYWPKSALIHAFHCLVIKSSVFFFFYPSLKTVICIQRFVKCWGPAIQLFLGLLAITTYLQTWTCNITKQRRCNEMWRYSGLFDSVLCNICFRTVVDVGLHRLVYNTRSLLMFHRAGLEVINLKCWTENRKDPVQRYISLLDALCPTSKIEYEFLFLWIILNSCGSIYSAI